MKQSTIAKIVGGLMLIVMDTFLIYWCIEQKSITLALLALPYPLCLLYATLFKKSYEEVTQEEEHKENQHNV